jgi:DNA polymerase-3 subunit delta
MRSEAPEVEISEIEAARLDRGTLVEITGPSLFSSRRAAVIYELENVSPDLGQDLVDLATEKLSDLAIILVHGGGAKGKGLVDKVKSAGADVIECAAVKTWELPQFVSAEVKQAGSSIEAGAAAALVDAVGHDLRALAAAVTQLISDGQGGPLSVDQVRRYFGGRAEVTSFAVADAALGGRTAGGGQREADLAREVGVPPWKLKSMRSQARGWDQGKLATALKAVAVADADVKGAADDPAFALERAVLSVSRLRR